MFRVTIPIGLYVLLLANCVPSTSTESRTARVDVAPLEIAASTESVPPFVGEAVSRSFALGLREFEGVVANMQPADASNEPATHVVSGRLNRKDGMTHVELRLEDIASGSELWSATASETNLSIAASDLAAQVADALGLRAGGRYDYKADLSGGAEMASSPRTAVAVQHWQIGDSVALEFESEQLVDEFPQEIGARLLSAWAKLFAWDRNPTETNLTVLRERLRTLTALDPDTPYDELFLGYVSRSSGAVERAVKLYSQVLVRTDLTNVTRAWALRQRSVAHQKMGRTEQALEDARQAVELDPASAASHFALSRSLESVERLPGATEAAQHALALNPSWRQHQRLGLALLRMNRLDESTQSLDTACQLSNSQEACANVAIGLLKAGMPEEARAKIEYAAGLSGTPFGAYNQACYWAILGDERRALSALREAAELGFADVIIHTDPDFESLRGNPELEALVRDIDQRIQFRRELSLSVFPSQS
ncbi:MAG: hypothetical protein GY716_03095 [bacterium]|nr:hypothetical protein [bacterium]